MAREAPADADAIVVGAGFAGIFAARDLAEAGRSVIVLEARERVGGRTWTRPFGGGPRVEMGGTWYSPQANPLVQAEVERYGVPVEQSPSPGRSEFITGGRRIAGPLGVPPEQLYDLERAYFHILAAAHRIDPAQPGDVQGLDDLDVSWAEFVAPLELPVETRESFEVLVAAKAGRRPEHLSALQMLSYVASNGHSALRVFRGTLSTRFREGTVSLLEAVLADAPSVDVRLDAPVAAIEQGAEGVAVRTRAGAVLRASAAVVAVPMNCWEDIAFSPALSTPKRDASAERHGSPHANKFWALVRGATEPVSYMASPAASGGLAFAKTEYQLGGAQLWAGFGCDPDGFDPTDRATVERAVETCSPDVELVAFDGHDWTADPYAKGAWVGYRPGRLSRSHSALGAQEGRLSFATADLGLDMRWICYLEAAVGTGRRAAAQALAAIA